VVDGPLIVAGYLNATSHAAAFERLVDIGLRDVHDHLGRGLATTWPNGVFSLPNLRLDHVLVTDELVPLAVREGIGEGSDHRPVIVDLALDHSATSAAGSEEGSGRGAGRHTTISQTEKATASASGDAT
jgi:endonuclease/exonuclease/phosphatase (EEP) superfamily protein YafD